MELVCRASPEITNLLWLNIARLKGRALQRRSRDLQNRQRRSVGRQRLGHSRNAGNERRQRKALPEGDQRRNRSNRVLHLVGEKD